jgi:hypothetical protein
LADEAFGRARVGRFEDAGALGVRVLGAAVVDGRGGHQADPGMAVLVVVLAEEVAAVRAGVLDRVEALREPCAVLEPS